MNFLSFAKVEMIAELTRQSFSGRQIAKMLGINRTTVVGYRRKMRADELTCGCGKQLLHRGWCSVRYARSDNRQRFMARWHGKPFENLEQIRQAFKRDNEPCYFGDDPPAFD